MNGLGEKILDHYERFLGSYLDAEKYHNGESAIQLLGFKNVFEECLTFATFGLSKYREDINNTCEIIMAVDDSFDDCALVFMNSVFYILSNKMNMGRGIMIKGADQIVNGFSAKHGKSALYFTETYIMLDEFSAINDECKFYMAFFISDKEAEYIEKFGCESFEDLLEEKQCDVMDLNRRSVV